ncbi:UDP-glucuronic acid decarboxylase 1-like [Dermacentor albipictus]|uniref:UDP-glucuronic acid decarboxylase 1-like n=1 Tax=Dermacentor albipictus TaxID=60249 RepID=UPI0031FDEE59
MQRLARNVPARYHLKLKMAAMYAIACFLVLALVALSYRQLESLAKASTVLSLRVPSAGFSADPPHPPVSVIAKQQPLLKTADEGGVDVKDKLIATMEQKLRDLEARIQKLEKNAPKTYPIVKQLDYREKKRILVAGGAGFVGSHLVDHLMQQGHQVTVVDNFFTGSKHNIEHWIGHHNFELIHHDIVSPLFIEVDYIYNLASPASPPHYMMNPVKTIKTNTLGTINMLGLARRVGARLLITSTSEVYGDPAVHPQNEDYWGHVNPVGPRSCYDEGKRVAETLCYAYAKQESVEVRVARVFNTYGPRMHLNDGRVVSNFILQALQDKPITVHGSGKQTRSFQYVSDLIDGLVALMNANYSRPINLGNPEEHTIEEFAQIVKNLVGGSSKIEYVSTVIDDPQRRKPDITRAKKYLDWEPKVPLLDGLRKTVDYFKEELTKNSKTYNPQLNQNSTKLK